MIEWEKIERHAACAAQSLGHAHPSERLPLMTKAGVRESIPHSRSEIEIFAELEALCSRPGYLHAVAFFAFRDSVVTYDVSVLPEDLGRWHTPEHLLRTEMNTLVGLALKSDVDVAFPGDKAVQEYVKLTEDLLHQLHKAVSVAGVDWAAAAELVKAGKNPFESGPAMREPMFYGAESAYPFQYVSFAIPKYEKDDDWLQANVGFTIGEACRVVSGIQATLNRRRSSDRHAPKSGARMDRFLSLFQITFDELLPLCEGLDAAKVRSVLGAFSVLLQKTNSAFKSIHDFNEVSARPIIQQSSDTFLVLQIGGLAEAIYESPFYWMLGDKGYQATALNHRGAFTEEFASSRLAAVFGDPCVQPNVKILDSGGTVLAEIDCLVTFADRGIVLQAKSKRLTLAARGGNEESIRGDFQKSVQDSYDQGLKCAQALGRGDIRLVGPDDSEVALTQTIRKVYPVCLVADHYPALSFQAMNFLKWTSDETIMAPFVMDVFTLDAIAEMLYSPLRFLSYIDRRVAYIDEVIASSELTVLGYHLKQNLWLGSKLSSLMLEDSLSTELDIAMLTRRAGLKGDPTPKGILTRFVGTPTHRWVSEIERLNNHTIVQFGLLLLSLSENATDGLNQYASLLARRTKANRKQHDAVMILDDAGTGIILHINPADNETSEMELSTHCAWSKYRHRLDRVFGVCLTPDSESIRIGIVLDFPWKTDDELEASVRETDEVSTAVVADVKRRITPKVGRNDPCDCGSGKKFKHCCGG